MMKDIIVKLNVGGTTFCTSRQTLTWIPCTFFSSLLDGEIRSLVDDNGAYFIDRDPRAFAVILSFLRTRRVDANDVTSVGLDALRHEAEFFSLTPLIERLDAGRELGGDQPWRSQACGGLLFNACIRSTETIALTSPVRCVTGHQSWIAVGYDDVVVCYSFKEDVGWRHEFQSPPIDGKDGHISHVAVNVKCGAGIDKMLAVAAGNNIHLWSVGRRLCDASNNPSMGVSIAGTAVPSFSEEVTEREPTREILGISSFNLGVDVDRMTFIGNQLVATSRNGRVVVRNTLSLTWQVQDVRPITSMDLTGQILFLGCDDGSIIGIDMKKFPLRLKDNDLLVNEVYREPSGAAITALSVWSVRDDAAGDALEIAYGTSTGLVRVIIDVPETAGQGPLLFQTYAVHEHPIRAVMLNSKHLLSVCVNDNHVRTWHITRFRGRMSTQPGTIPVASFKLGQADALHDVGPYGDRDNEQVFIQKFATDTSILLVRESSTGRRVCLTASIDDCRITCFCVHEHSAAPTFGRSQRFLVTGHTNGNIQIWDLKTAFDRYARELKNDSEFDLEQSDILQLLGLHDL